MFLSHAQRHAEKWAKKDRQQIAVGAVSAVSSVNTISSFNNVNTLSSASTVSAVLPFLGKMFCVE